MNKHHYCHVECIIASIRGSTHVCKDKCAYAPPTSKCTCEHYREAIRQNERLRVALENAANDLVIAGCEAEAKEAMSIVKELS